MHNYLDLNQEIRNYMLEAILEADETGNIYVSTIFTEDAKKNWVSLLKEAAQKHDEDWLANELNTRKSFLAKNPKTGRDTPWNAAQTLAFGQFKRFYILGLCTFAKKKSYSHIKVYRAMETEHHREESDELIGKSILIDDIEKQLKDVNEVFSNIFTKPNSGLCAKLPE